MTSEDKLRILYNILARSGGIENVDLSSELAKSMAIINGLDAQSQMMDMQNMANQAIPQPPESTISPEMGQSTPQEGTPPVM